MNQNVAPATQNLAMNALIFLYRRVLKLSMEGNINAVDRKVHVPVVMTREEVAAAISLMNSPPQLVAKLLLRQRPANHGGRASCAGKLQNP